jgi:hypothetical protein
VGALLHVIWYSESQYSDTQHVQSLNDQSLSTVLIR